MHALRLVGLAILTAIAPIAVLIGSSPAHADTDIGQPCSPEGAKLWGNPGPIYCERTADGQLQWVSINSCLGIVCGVLRPAWRAIGAHQRTPTVRRPASPAMSSRWFGSSRWAHCRSPRPCRPARRNSPLRRGGCRRTAGRSNRCCTSKSACPPWPCANRT